ncbi:hypothetical protein SLS63_013770 [Diaporthe eres]|uniref:Uncharacterized protein n=1 Tax=Diaporthe eres TaxID=83184 RepID=A0ABR1NMI6_DIAER
MALDQVRECRLGREAHTRFRHGRHLLSITTAPADRICILMDTAIGTATATVNETERLETDHLWSAEAMSTHTFQAIANVNENGSASARGIVTEIETVHRATVVTVADPPLVEGYLTETGSTQETADSVTAFPEPAVGRARGTEASINLEKGPTEGIDLKNVGCQLDRGVLSRRKVHKRSTGRALLEQCSRCRSRE